MIPRSFTAAMLLAGLLVAPGARGVSAQVWKHRGLAGFAGGKLDGVSITARGWLRLAPPQKALPRPAALYVWAVAEDSKGNVYVGTGTKGAVFKVNPAGEISLHFATGEMNVHALAVDDKDHLYAGTSPHGLVYRIAPDGSGRIIFRTGAVYVWALALEPGGDLLIATGKEGRILRLRAPAAAAAAGGEAERPPAGPKTRTDEPEVLYAGPDTHVLCLLPDAALGVVAGTAPSGLLVRVDAKGKAHVLLDAQEPEIHAVVKDARGRLLAVTASGGAVRSAKRESPPESDAKKDKEDEREPGENSVYLIEPATGRVVRALGIKKTSMFAAATTREGGVFIGTGDEGNLVRIGPELGLELLLDLPERQILCLSPTRSGDLLVGTGNGASVVRVGRRFRAQGDYLSEPLDSRWGAQWGKLTWIGAAPKGTRVTFSTRSGNTAKPDATWTAWQEVKNSGRVLTVRTAGGRYLQYRVRFTTGDPTKSPLVEEVALSYLPRNLPPHIKEIRIGAAPPPAEKTKDHNEKPEPKRSTVLNLAWTAEDPNSDPLNHAIYFRMEGDHLWTLLVKDLENASYKWDTADMPDGLYRILVRCTDAPGNPEASAGKSERVSEPFAIDNTPPRIAALKARNVEGGRIEIRGRAYDEVSPIRAIAYAIGNGKWQPVGSEDGILDAREETFVFRTPPLRAGTYYVRVRATDAKGNCTVSRVMAAGGGPTR